MKTKTEILRALELAIADHKVHAGSCTDWSFVEALTDAKTIVAAAETVEVPGVALAKVQS